jgi:GNAT superfamily N-acetyltransferase
VILFSSGDLSAAEMAASEVPELQRLFEENPGYHVLTAGRPPTPTEAQEEFEVRPAFPYGHAWVLSVRDGRGELAGIAGAIADIFAAHTWTVGFYFLASRLHGTGVAHGLYDAMEAWMKSCGARWSRLGVVAGNDRALRFWARCGYQAVRMRRGVEIGVKVNDIVVMAKPLAGGTLAEYLAHVPRDRPESD